jgi:hypothetical protein
VPRLEMMGTLLIMMAEVALASLRLDTLEMEHHLLSAIIFEEMVLK